MSLCRYLPTPSDRMGILWSLLSIEGGIILEYGPAGTTHFSMSLFGELGIDQQNRLFTTHMSEDDVVMGSVSRLEEALVEVDQAYAPEAIFVVASSISAVIGTDLKGVCAYMQEKVSAKLVALEQGGFRGDYSVGLKEIYRLLAEEIVEPGNATLPGTYNLLGMSMGSYRARSDLWELQDLMERAFGMRMQACFCADTSLSALRAAGQAEINLVLREEALPCAKILSDKCGTPWIAERPYGYAGTLAFLKAVSERIGRPIHPDLMRALQKRAAEARQYPTYLRMLRKHRPAATLVGEYATVQGLAGLMAELGIPVDQKISLHTLAAVETPDAQVSHLPHEKERMERMRALHGQLVLADDVSLSLCAADNVGLRVSTPLVFGAQVANHLPLMGMRGADYVLETVERYLQTLS